MSADAMSLKTDYRENHAGRRLAERYGVELTDELKLRICREIKRTRSHRFRKGHGDVPLAARRISMNGEREVWSVVDGGIEFRVVYNPANRVIVTFLPPAGAERRPGARR